MFRFLITTCLLVTPALGGSIFYGSDNEGTHVQLILNGGATTLDSVASGWFTDSGENNSPGPLTNYITGFCSDCESGTYRSFFSFDLMGITGITSADLRIYTFTYDGASIPSQTLSLYDVTTSLVTLQTPSETDVATYSDLGSGILYGTRVYTIADEDQFRTIALNADAIAALQAASGIFSIGGAADDGGSSEVPEPSTYALAGSALMLVWFRNRK